MMTKNHEAKTTSTTNLILYGPPGTGKIYETAWEAVRLCLGNKKSETLRAPKDRDLFMDKYKQLVKDNRIEFITFHQSMSYEEFVEGLQPETQNARQQDSSNNSSESGGFRLEPKNGILKKFSKCEEESKKDDSVQDYVLIIDEINRLQRLLARFNDRIEYLFDRDYQIVMPILFIVNNLPM